MPCYIDYSGRRIGRVKVLIAVEKSTASRWECLCDCGKTFICLSKSFKRGETFECNDCRFERRRGVDLTGRRFGRWSVIQRQVDSNNKTVWLVECDCGNRGLVATYSLGRRGKSMSCGCLGRKEKSVRANTTLYPPQHLTSETKIYGIRARILQNCYNPEDVAYKNYGGLGITVCDLWRNSAKDFYEWCTEKGWQEGYVVHLNNGEKVFSPETCCILSPEESTREQLSKKITIDNETLNVFEWSNLSGVSRHTILDRLKKGYTEKEAVFGKKWKNSGKRFDWPDDKIRDLYAQGFSLADIGRRLNMNYTAVSKRLKLMNIEVDQTCRRRKFSEKECIICGKFFEPTNSTAKKCIPCR